jgi:hypothetical protein
MTKDEALDLALDALLWANNEINEWRDDAYGYKPEDQPQIMKAITAIKQARSAPVQEPDLIARLKHPEHYYECTDPKKANAVLMSLCQEAADALSAPVQSCYCPNCEALSKELAAFKAQPAPVKEPSGHFIDFAAADTVAQVHVYDTFTKGQEFYTTPPAAQRQWAVPATMKVSTAPSYEFANGWNACVATIEAKLRSKNNG